MPEAAAIEEAAAWIARARRPVVITQRAGAFARGFTALTQFAERCALPVVEFWPSRISLPVDHPMHAGFDPGPLLAEADLVVVVDGLTPWIPLRHGLPDDCRVIQLGPDPLFAWAPVRGMPSDLTLAGDVAATLELLTAEVARRAPDRAERREPWRPRTRRPAASGWRQPRPARACRCRRPMSAAGSPRPFLTMRSCSPSSAAIPRS